MWSLEKRLGNGYDRYKNANSSLSYAPAEYLVYKNGRRIKNAVFADTDSAKAFIKELQSA